MYRAASAYDVSLHSSANHSLTEMYPTPRGAEAFTDINVRVNDVGQQQLQNVQPPQPLQMPNPAAGQQQQNQNAGGLVAVAGPTPDYCSLGWKRVTFSLGTLTALSALFGYTISDNKNASAQIVQKLVQGIHIYETEIFAMCGTARCSNNTAVCQSICAQEDGVKSDYDSSSKLLDNTSISVYASFMCFPLFVPLNCLAAAKHASKRVVTAAAISNFILGSALIVSALYMPPTLTVAKPFSLAFGSFLNASAVGFAVKAAGGGLGSLCSKVTSCFKKCLWGRS